MFCPLGLLLILTRVTSVIVDPLETLDINIDLTPKKYPGGRRSESIRTAKSNLAPTKQTLTQPTLLEQSSKLPLMMGDVLLGKSGDIGMADPNRNLRANPASPKPWTEPLAVRNRADNLQLGNGAVGLQSKAEIPVVLGRSGDSPIRRSDTAKDIISNSVSMGRKGVEGETTHTDKPSPKTVIENALKTREGKEYIEKLVEETVERRMKSPESTVFDEGFLSNVSSDIKYTGRQSSNMLDVEEGGTDYADDESVDDEHESESQEDIEENSDKSEEEKDCNTDSESCHMESKSGKNPGDRSDDQDTRLKQHPRTMGKLGRKSKRQQKQPIMRAGQVQEVAGGKKKTQRHLGKGSPNQSNRNRRGPPRKALSQASGGQRMANNKKDELEQDVSKLENNPVMNKQNSLLGQPKLWNDQQSPHHNQHLRFQTQPNSQIERQSPHEQYQQTAQKDSQSQKVQQNGPEEQQMEKEPKENDQGDKERVLKCKCGDGEKPQISSTLTRSFGDEGETLAAERVIDANEINGEKGKENNSTSKNEEKSQNKSCYPKEIMKDKLSEETDYNKNTKSSTEEVGLKKEKKSKNRFAKVYTQTKEQLKRVKEREENANDYSKTADDDSKEDSKEEKKKKKKKKDGKKETKDSGENPEDQKENEDRIVNGYKVNGRTYYAALVNKQLSVSCGGTLISNRYVISAAHCFCGGRPRKGQKNVHCTQEFVTDFQPYVVVLGAVDISLEGGTTYTVESVRHPKERIAMYSRGQYEGPNDLSLIKTEQEVVFVPGKIMPICLGKVKDIDVDVFVTGLGTSGFTGQGTDVTCWTDIRGSDIFQECQTMENKCNMEEDPQTSDCRQFFKTFGGEDKFRNQEKADGALINGTLFCYAVKGSGEFGWCRTGSKPEYWGYCSDHCKKKGNRHVDTLQETGIRVLSSSTCTELLKEDPFDISSELCVGLIITNSQVIKKFDGKDGKFASNGYHVDDKLKIGGSDSCQNGCDVTAWNVSSMPRVTVEVQ